MSNHNWGSDGNALGTDPLQHSNAPLEKIEGVTNIANGNNASTGNVELGNIETQASITNEIRRRNDLAQGI